ncbi:MAG: DNA polymerase III subunit alpha [Spirochaetales bacterium]|nr:DNA polymerase III subunit alpha [Spirochaetales bacterium]MCF7937077.1 DNA polymerase III subunit alpha [Spirochaetales bacterium]
MADFVHLHVHSDYSLLDGAAAVEKLVDRAAEYGFEELALTDHGNMFGALHFYKACRKRNIKPIIGCEFYRTPGSRHTKTPEEKHKRLSHLVLLAKNRTGYRNLMILSSLSFLEGFYYKPRIDDELLEKYHEGLICLTSCLAGDIPQDILNGRNEEAEKRAFWYRNLFGEENFYLEIQDHGIPEQETVKKGIVQLSRKTGIPIVASNDVHYVDKSDANAQDILLCIGTNKKQHEAKRMQFKGDGFYLKSESEMRQIFADLPETLTNTKKVAAACDLEIELPGPILPFYRIPEGYENPDAYLRDLTYQGLKERYPQRYDEVKDRADYELNIIISMGFTGYFLIVWDFIHFARVNNIPVGPGRGSGAGSVVAYALKITDIEPLKYNLLFERFLNPERVSMPDFDIDFCFERRQEVIDYVTKKYGSDRVAQIITFGTLKARAVIRDVARVLDIPYAESDSTAKLVPEGPKMTLEKALQQEPRLQEVADRGGVYEALINESRRLEGLNRHASTHAAGIVIGKEPLTEYVPLYRDPKTGAVSTQYTMDLLEECGLVKMDFLGLKTLTLIENTVRLIKKQGIEIDLDTIEENDEATFRLLGDGNSMCVFQFESSGMQQILKQAKPNSIEDLIALNALYRPGPMDNIDQFVNAKNGKESIRYPLPELEPVLKETYGVIVYQEQVMEIAQIVGGYSLGQADILRRAMGKKKAEVMPKLKKDFVDGALEKGYTRQQAESIFDLLIPFAGYGFNKSHAAAYSVLAYKTAYLKANYPVEFMAANLTNEINDTKKFAVYLDETRQLGIEILPPDINISEKYFTVSEGKIVYGLLGIKNVGSAAVDGILSERSENGRFTSFIDFLERIDMKTVNRKVTETLIQTGTFDNLDSNRATLFANLDKLIDIVGSIKESREYGQSSLFEQMDQEVAPDIEIEQVPEWSELERLRYEKENLGFFLSGHPLDQYKEIWKNASSIDLRYPERAMKDKRYTAVALIKEYKQLYTKKGDMMAAGAIEDYRGTIPFVVFPRVYQQYQHLLETDRILGLSGQISDKRGEHQLSVEEIKAPEELEKLKVREVHIRLKNSTDHEALQSLHDYVLEHQGASPLYFHIPKNGSDVIIRASQHITISDEKTTIAGIRQNTLVQEVWQE